MAGFRKQQPPETPPRPIIASAARVTRESFKNATIARPWQADAWKYYRKVGAVRFGVDWLAQSISRIRLYLGTPNPDGVGDPVPTENEAAKRILAEWAGGQDGQAQLLQRLAQHLSVPGESFLISYQDDDGEIVWQAATKSEIERKGQGINLLVDQNARVPIDPDTNLIVRIWREDPERAWEADSPMRSLIDDCATLCSLNARVLAEADSRLAGNGMLVIPESATLAPAQAAGQREAVHDDPFMASLIEAMMTPLEDRGSASAVVPIVLRVPDDAVGKIQHVTFSSDFDDEVPDLADATLRRIAIGLDVPPEIVLGTGTANHWGAWAIDEGAVKVHILPLAQILCTAITDRIIRPLLEQAGISDELIVAPDASELVQRPDRTSEAMDLYKINALSARAMLREAGFADEDAPDEQELRHQLLVQLAGTPQGAQLIAQHLGLEVSCGCEPAGGGAPSAPEAPAPPQRALPTAPEGSSPAEGAQSRSAALAVETGYGTTALELAVLRALEVAGKRLLSPAVRGRYRHVPPWELHTRLRPTVASVDRLLDGAWDTLTASGAPAHVLAELDSYTRGLLVTGRAYARTDLLAQLDQETV